MTALRYDQSMTVKITVSLPDELVAKAKAAVKAGKAASVSAYVAEAIAEKDDATSLADLLDEWDQEYGPPSDADYAWADAELARVDEERR